MSSLARSVLGLIFSLLRRANVEKLSDDQLTELMRLVRSLSMSAPDETDSRVDLRRLSEVLDGSGIFQTGRISPEDSREAAEIAQAVMLQLYDEETSGANWRRSA